ncbi:MAG TPA: proline dehydrogenase family protein [Baekduia sp.]|nr:proline dehydrogenase family protein [Baekduia sp.]
MPGLRRRALFRLATNPLYERAILGTPPLRARAWSAARRYVAGETLQDAVAVVRALDADGLAASIDLFGEGVTDPAHAARVADAYVELAGALDATPPGTWLSIDLSHIAFDAGHLTRIAAALPPGRVLQVGAEEAETTDRVQAAVLAAHAQGLPVAATLLANLRRSPLDARALAAAGVPVRLVKGAYVEPAAVAHPYGPATDAAYAQLARTLGAGGGDLYLATHDDALRAPLLAELPDATCELLLGIHLDRARALAAAGRTVRVYVPFGSDWLRYFLRRRAEAQGTG